MTEPATAALVEQVRAAVLYAKRDCPTSIWHELAHDPNAALTALVKRLEAAERHEGDHSDAICDLKEHLEVAERERDELWEFNQKLAADHYFARAEAAEAEVERLREALERIAGFDPDERAWDYAEVKSIARAALAIAGGKEQ